MVSLQQLLKTAVQQNASDLHITANSPPVLRVNGSIVKVKIDKLSPDECQSLLYSILTDSQKSRLESTKELDFSFAVKDFARFRGNMFYQRGNLSGVFRKIPSVIPALEDLGLPKAVDLVTKFDTGLVLVTGATGSGKSTTVAALVDRLNNERNGHILTVEDPIEFIFSHKKCIVNQREVEHDTTTFGKSLRQALRQDPDIVFIGELRDLETIESALKIAETGHLVFSTLHTNGAVSTISRIINVFPSEDQDRIRTLLSFVLKGVISQALIPDVAGNLLPVAEVLFVNAGIGNLIRENKMHQIYGMMQIGQEKSGMTTINQSLLGLVLRRRIELKTAFEHTPDPEEFNNLLKKAGV
ncbi:MAG: type IV pili twitching motility protein PilT [Proteobacteria bacterium SG_bin7]|nr:MAG: type IV pili twitching motility protein PilT [Proteobacteria bacterium SG_bin7]